MFFFKQKTSYEMRISDWSSDVCSSGFGQNSGGLPGRTDAQQAQPDHGRCAFRWPVRSSCRPIIVNVLARTFVKRAPSDWRSCERGAWGENYVCSVDPSIRCGLRRLTDDGAPPFFPAIGRPFLNRQRCATPAKIVPITEARRLGKKGVST